MSDANKPNLNDTKISEIDRALAQATARKAAKAGMVGADKPAKAPRAASEPKQAKASDEEKAARVEARKAEQLARSEARALARAEKLALRNNQPAHMKKVLKASERLGALGQAEQLLFNEATSNLTQAQLASLAQHILHFNRVKATERALKQALTVGQQVTIISGDPRYVGRTGTVAKSQRIRAYITLEGLAKPIYVFTSDVAPITVEAAAINE